MAYRPPSPWRSIPALHALAPLAAGIGAADLFPIPLSSTSLLFLLTLLVLALFELLPLQLRHPLRLLPAPLIYVLFFSLGAGLCLASDPRASRHWTGHWLPGPEWLIVTTDGPPDRGNKSWRVACQMQWGRASGGWQRASGGLLLYLPAGTDPGAWRPGSRVLLYGSPQPLSRTGNPGSFEWADYALRQGWTHRLYAPSRSWKLLSSGNRGSLAFRLHRLRAVLLHRLRAAVRHPEAQGLAEALLIGYRKDLDPALLQAYIRTGTVHVIAVSGLHLGLIFLLLRAALRPLQRRYPVAAAGLCLLCLWTFAGLAGFSPSVVRSALMFSMLGLSGPLGRRTSPVNSLFISALLLLVFRPQWLWDVGFTLSYTAVGGILFFYASMLQALPLHHPLLHRLWAATAATLSAQLLTTPVTVFYFHQFPLLFLPANLIAVPLSSALLMALIGVCALPPGWGITEWTGRWTAEGIRFMNRFVQALDSLPGAVLEGLQVSAVQALLLAGIGACIGLAWKRGPGPLLWPAGALLMAFLGLQARHRLQAQHQEVLIIYALRGGTAVELIRGREGRIIFSPGVTRDHPVLQGAATHFRLLRRSPLPRAFSYRGWKVGIYPGYVVVAAGRWKRVFHSRQQQAAFIHHFSP